MLAVLKDPWRAMIAVNAAIMAMLFVYKVLYNEPHNEYLHLIIDYHFGFTKRAFVGALVSLAVQVVPKWLVYALGGAAWAAALLLFLRLFRTTFGHSTATAPLFVFMFGSPFFLKNFVQTVGYFDIYGCILALIMLLVPARSFAFVVFGAAGCVLLLLIHPIHMLLYIPTIALITVIRYYLAGGATFQTIAGGVGLAVIFAGIFAYVAFFGATPASMDELIGHLRERTTDSSLLTPITLDIWYRPISDELERTWNAYNMGRNATRFPVYFILIALHWPVIRYGGRLIDAVADTLHRRLLILGVFGVTLGYVIIGIVVFDYARWFSNWAVCMFLIMHAAKMMPARREALAIADDRWTRSFGWLITAVPRVGTTRPF